MELGGALGKVLSRFLFPWESVYLDVSTINTFGSYELEL